MIAAGRGGPLGVHRGRWRGIALGAVVLAMIVFAGRAAAQDPCVEPVGTLGVTGMRCEGCTLRLERGVIELARFRTEPQVLAVARGLTRGDRIRAGDRIVALDGTLVTTARGSRALTAIRPGQDLSIRVRREGDLRDLQLVAGSACELRRRMDAGRLDVDRVEAPDPRYPDAPAPADVPGPPQAAGTGTPPPIGYLGIGIKCTNCAFGPGGIFFTSPPVILAVREGGPAARAGLEAGDEIIAVDGADLTGDRGAAQWGAIEPGDTIRVTVRRDGQRRTLTLVAGSRPGG